MLTVVSQQLGVLLQLGRAKLAVLNTVEQNKTYPREEREARIGQTAQRMAGQFQNLTRENKRC